LVSGGFHGDGIQAVLQEKGINYAVLTPRIQKIDQGDLYEKAMGDTNADLSLYFKEGNPFATKQQALFVKEIIETAVPVLREKYHLTSTGISELFGEVFKSHPVLSGAFQVLPRLDKTTIRLAPNQPSPVLGKASASTVADVPITLDPAAYFKLRGRIGDPAAKPFEICVGSKHTEMRALAPQIPCEGLFRPVTSGIPGDSD